jgi:hypothetical protein
MVGHPSTTFYPEDSVNGAVLPGVFQKSGSDYPPWSAHYRRHLKGHWAQPDVFPKFEVVGTTTLSFITPTRTAYFWQPVSGAQRREW